MVQISAQSALVFLLGAVSSVQACTGPAVNSATVDLVKSFEQYSSTIYPDQAGYPTVGYGHKCSNSQCSNVPYPIPISQANARSLLASDLAIAQDCITTHTKTLVVLNANQYGALVSWAFNIGCSAATSSTLISRMNNGENVKTVADAELPKWKYAGGEVSNGLVRRRQAEVDLFDTYTSASALPAGC